MNNSLLPIAVCAFPERPASFPRGVAHSHYIHEILGHAGLCYRALGPEQLVAVLPGLRVLITIGEYELPDETREQLQVWVRGGGAWLSIAGTCGCADLFGVVPAQPAYKLKWGAPGACVLGEGYLAPGNGEVHRILQHIEIPLHFFNGLAVEIVESAGPSAVGDLLDVHGRAVQRTGSVENRVGQGRCLLIAPDAVGAVQHIQQGRAVTRDGVSAPDGTAPVTDGILKSDDGMVLDWHFDRQDVPGVPGLRAFLQPVADQWREVILRGIFHLAEATATPLPLLWLYPRNLPALAHMSHDSDNNVPEKAVRLLELVAEADIRTTWCIIAPGYERSLIEDISAAGHELAMHYDAVSPGCPWNRELFDQQWRFLRDLCGETLVSNKNHYTRWEGDTEFFEWCVSRGIQLDQSKGASKTGEAGFNFGTCHPYFPVDPDGGVLDVLELPTPTQDLEVFAPTPVAYALLEATYRNHGVLHILFHPGHTDKTEVGAALLEIAAAAKGRGLEWWTARDLNAWERARRAVLWTATSNGISLRMQQDLSEATILLLNATSNGRSIEGATDAGVVTRWGFDFHAYTLNIEAGVDYFVG